MRQRVFVNLALAVILLFTVSAAVAQPQAPAPVGEITIVAKEVAAGVGWTWGTGTLKFKGTTYNFDIKGLNVAAVGISQITAKGKATNLKDAADLAGTYVSASAGVAVGKGKAGLVMRNDKGVVINLISDQTGAQLNLGSDGLKITMKN